jgi:hypothetical protein
MEGCVSDKSRDLAAIALGAVLGGLAGYTLFTERGRRFRRQFEPTLEDFGRELNHFRSTMQKLSGVVNDGWKALNDAVGDQAPPPRYADPHQTSPF